MNTKRYYFQIKSANILDYVEALSFVDAKRRAAHEYMDAWNEIQWFDTSDPDPLPEQLSPEAQQECARLFF
jgi:hypothetical protein